MFFAPEAAVEAHFISHCIVSKTLQSENENVLIVRCDSNLPRCVVYDGMRLDINASKLQKNSICDSCRDISYKLTEKYEIQSISLDEILTDDLKNHANNLLDNFEGSIYDFEIDGFNLGKIAAGDTARMTKINDLKLLENKNKKLLYSHVLTALYTYLAINQLVKLINVSHLIYFNEYAVNISAGLAAQQTGVKIYNMTQASIHSIDRRKIVLVPEVLGSFNYHRQLDKWNEWKNLSIQPEKIKEIMDDSIYRMDTGGFVIYSPKKNNSSNTLHEDLSLSEDRKLLVAYTSSVDEIVADRFVAAAVGSDLYSNPQPFSNQIEWLNALCDWVEESDNYQLVVRIHPREAPNKREGVSSQHLEELLSNFNNEYKHVRFIWPNEKISSYYLMEQADVGLISWSTMGIEMARLGVPVVATCYKYTAFPIDSFIMYSNTVDGYFHSIEKAANKEINLESILYAHRWFNSMYLASYIDVSDIVPSHLYSGVPKFKNPKSSKLLKNSLINDIRLTDASLKNLEEIQSENLKIQEIEMLKKQLRRMIHFFVTDKDCEKDISVTVTSSNYEYKNQHSDIEIDILRNKVFCKTSKSGSCDLSPLVKRIALLCA